MNEALKPKYLSRYGSYMILTYIDRDMDPNTFAASEILKKGTYLRSARGKSTGKKAALKLIPTVKGKEIDYECETDFDAVRADFEGGKIAMTFGDRDTVVVEGNGKNVGLILDTMATFKFDYILSIPAVNGECFSVTSYKTLTKYLVYAVKGKIILDQNYYGDEYYQKEKLVCRLKAESEDGHFLIAIREIEGNMIEHDLRPYDFETSRTEMLNDLNAFRSRYPQPAAEWKETFDLCTYTLWSAGVRASGKLKKDMVMMSNNAATSAWAYDAGLTAYGLAKAHPQLALNQITNFLDRMDSIGAVPGSINDCSEKFIFLKAPAQGLFLSKLLKMISADRKTKRYLYDALIRELRYYQKYKDSNQDGICEYHQGNEATLDNSTTFDQVEVIDSPCLTAYLIKMMDLLSELAGELIDEEASRKWKQEADELMAKALNYFVTEDNDVVARLTKNGEAIREQAILPYMFVVLGERLPAKLKKNLLRILREDFLAPYGLASEKLTSPKYQDDGYFRGPVWVQTTLPYVDGIEDCGDPELAREAAIRFCNAVRKSGSAENFDAKTGEGYRDPVNTTSSGVFLYFYEKYLSN